MFDFKSDFDSRVKRCDSAGLTYKLPVETVGHDRNKSVGYPLPRPVPLVDHLSTKLDIFLFLLPENVPFLEP